MSKDVPRSERPISSRKERKSRPQQVQRGRGGRGRGGRANHQRQPDEAEAELVEAVTIECFNTEITQELSSMLEISHDSNAQVPNASEGPEVFFANADASTHQESAPVDQPDDSQAVDSSPSHPAKAESTPFESMPRSPWRPMWVIALLTFFLTAAAGISEEVRAIFCSWFKWFRTTGVWIFSFITNLLQAMQSAKSCSTARYKLHFRFLAVHICSIAFGLPWEC